MSAVSETLNATFDLCRTRMRKSIWCEGCGLGNLQQGLTKVLVRHVAGRLGLDPHVEEELDRIKDNIAMVSGIGCTSRLPGHLDLNTVHTTHGRALGFATGLKMARPDLTVVLAAGDGDIFAIGGNHFIHAARRNPDLTLIVYDNESYGMTGSQHSPTSPLGERGTSAPYGVFEPPFDLVALAQGAGASFVAQAAVTMSQEHQTQLEDLIAQALAYKGFSFVNVCGSCHTGWGEKNARADAYHYRQYIEKRTMPVERWRELPQTDQADFIPLGVIVRKDRTDIQNSVHFQEARERAQAFESDEVLEQPPEAQTDRQAEFQRTSLRFAGTGGQGVISAGEIALSAALEAGQSGVFTKNYGPEARGGEAYSDVIISAGEVHFPETDQLDVLVALNQETFDKFRDAVSPNGTIIVNSTEVFELYNDSRVVASPIGELNAHEVRPPKRNLGINVLALAVTLGYLGLVPREALETAVMEGLGKKKPALNRKALAVGFSEAERLAAER
jgi:2-oxoglutarate ferredoxin oxidoreductase subunit beta